MIPYIEQPSVSLGPLTVHAFGAIVVIAAFTGLTIGARLFDRAGLDADVGERFAWWSIAAGFLGAHVFAVLFYVPHRLVEDPLVLLKLWDPISSFGGMIGGTIGMWSFFRFRGRGIGARERLEYLDGAALAFAVSLMIGRIACSLAHDHPGTVTTFPLAVSLASERAQGFIQRVYAASGRLAELPAEAALSAYGFHDLGWYEFLYLAIFVVPAMLLLGRRQRTAGFHAAAFVLLYMPVRFLLDFLRVGDARYAGLTPAQWAALVALGALAVVIARMHHEKAE